jgi:hypothetical protein
MTSCYRWKILVYIYLKINIKKQLSIFLRYIQEKTYQDQVFVLLQPEWYTRYEKFACLQTSSVFSIQLQGKTNKRFKKIIQSPINFYKTYMNIFISNKLINYKYIVNKIQSTKIISNRLNIWLNLLDNDHKKIKVVSRDVYNCNKNLYQLLKNILYLGVEWQIYINLKIKHIYKTIIAIHRNEFLYVQNLKLKLSCLKTSVAVFMKNLDISLNSIIYKQDKVSNKVITMADIIIAIQNDKTIIIKPSNNSIKILLSHIRSVLYRKNKIGQWRLKTYLNSAIAKSKIEQISLKWNQYYTSCLDHKQLYKIDYMINKIFYSWQIKK